MQRSTKVLLVTAVAVFMGFLDVTIVNVAFPDIESDFPEASRADLSWVLNAYNIVFAALLVPAGRLADLVGRRRMFLIGIGAFLATSVLCGLAGSPELLVAARVLQAPRARSSCLPRSRCCCRSSRRPSAPPRWRSGAPPAPSRPRSARRSAACSLRSRLALGVLRERADRPGRAAPRAPPAARNATSPMP